MNLPANSTLTDIPQLANPHSAGNYFQGLDQNAIASEMRRIADDIEEGRLHSAYFSKTQSVGSETVGHIDLTIRLIPKPRHNPPPSKEPKVKKPPSRSKPK